MTLATSLTTSAAPIVPCVANALAGVRHGRKSGGLATAFSVFGCDDRHPRMED